MNNYSLNTVKKSNNEIYNYLPQNNSIELKKIFEKIEKKIKNNDIVEEDLLLITIDDLKKYVCEYNTNINDRFNEEYVNDKKIYLDNIKNWNIIQNDFNNDAIVFFN